MKVIFALLFVLFVNNFANADDFELSVYFNLGTSVQHGQYNMALYDVDRVALN